MKFRRERPGHEPEINLIPFIDVLLVLVIFLMLTTTWSRLTEINLSLPVANAERESEKPRQVQLSISADGRYTLQEEALDGASVALIASALRPLTRQDTVLVISADAATPHQAVVSAMEAARRVGLSQVTFATRSSEQAGS
jgi:biopolymer transport protein ExbD